MKILILEKDGILIRPKSGGELVQHPHDQVLIDGVAETIALYRKDSWELAIASNQGRVEAGHKSLEGAIAEMRYAMELAGIRYAAFAPSYEVLSPEVVFLDSGVYVHLKEKTAEWRHRKPSPGMVCLLTGLINPSGLASRVVVVGDRDEDRLLATYSSSEFMDAEQWRSQ